jgi:pentatricopeptide repeat protein
VVAGSAAPPADEAGDAAAALVAALIRDCSTDAALASQQFVEPNSRVLEAAAAAFAAKRSSRGVAAVRRLAASRRLLRGGPPAARLWFALIAAYGALGRLDDVRAAFKAARASGAWALGDTWHLNVYLHALHSDASLAFVRARQLLDEGAAPDASTFNTLLKACMRARDSRRADLAARWMAAAGVAPDAVTYSCLVKAHSYAGNFDGVLGVRQAMADAGFAPTPAVWGSLLVACGAAQQHETALQLWREAGAAAAAAGGACVPTSVCNAMMTACNACLQGERALEVLAEHAAAGGRPTATTYNLAIKACQPQPGQRMRHSQMHTALRLYAEMQGAGAEPDAFTYGTLLELCAEAGEGRLAAELHAQMAARGVRANVVVTTSLVKALARAGMVDECLEAFGRTVWGAARVRPTPAAFRTLVRELRRAGALGAALRVYEGMRRAHHAPNNPEFQELLAAAAEAALAQGDPRLQAQVASLCGVASREEVDLHGMSTREARAAVLCVLGLALGEFQAGGGGAARALQVITGRGGHSEGGTPVVRAAVLRLLREELRLEAREVEGNPGRIVVDGEELGRWLAARCAARQGRELAPPAGG